MPDDVRLPPAERVEHPAGIRDVQRNRVRPFRRGRLEPSLLVPDDVVLLCELVGERAQVVEAEPRTAVQQENLSAALPARPPASNGTSSCVVNSVHRHAGIVARSPIG